MPDPRPSDPAPPTTTPPTEPSPPRPLVDVSRLPGPGWPPPPSLECPWLSLRPTTPDDPPALYALCDANTFRWYSVPPPVDAPDAFAAHYRRLIADPARRHLTMRLPDGRIVGASAYYELRPEHLSLEIGYTFIGPAFRGGRVNPAAKLLMIGHAIDTLGCVRVQIKTDARNLHSQRAITKLGARFEGRLRAHFIQPNGYVRDTMMYSVTPDLWPAIRAGLLQRLA